ncbi:MAG TPA: VWA domain-containing protein, partial [Bryobacteraceae bacterium]|nr:VWA domain-containing protein [Bryobacteraceae bacterium]
GSKGVQGLMSRLPPGERIALYVITKFEGLVQVVDLTTDWEHIRRAMAAFSPSALEPAPPGMDQSSDGHGMVEALTPRVTPADNAFTPRMSPREREYFMRRGAEDVRLSLGALAERLRSLPGRKSVFWITEGFPPRMIRNDPAWDKTFTNLNDANIAVNTVDTDGLGGPTRFWGPGGTLSVRMVAERTGGEAFYHRNDLDGAMAQGIQDSRSGYTLGFYLTDLDGKYHELKVVVHRPGLDLNYRRGYLAETDAMHDLAERKTDLDSVVLNPLDLTGLSIVASIETKADNLTVHLRLDPKSLTVTQRGGFWNGRIEELFIERNEAGGQVARIRQTSQLKIAEAAKVNYDRAWPSLTNTFKLAPNATKLMIVVRDSASGRTGSLTLQLATVPAN